MVYKALKRQLARSQITFIELNFRCVAHHTYMHALFWADEAPNVDKDSNAI